MRFYSSLLIVSTVIMPFLFTNFSAIAQETQKPSSANLSIRENSIILEKQVEELIKNVDKAVENKDITTLLKFFAPFVVSEMTFNKDNYSYTIKLNGMEEHRIYFEESFKELKNREILFDDYQISIEANGAIAYITSNRVANYTTKDDQKIISSAKAKIRLAMVAGELKIIEIEQNADISLRPNTN